MFPDVKELPPILAIVPVVASTLLSLIAMMFLRANRRHPDFLIICILMLVAGAVWMLIAVLYAPPAIEAVQKHHVSPATLSEFVRHPFVLWGALGAPAFPYFMTTLIMTFWRGRRTSFLKRHWS